MKRTLSFLLLSLCSMLILAACGPTEQVADLIIKGQVRTMADSIPGQPEECVAIAGGKIIYTGTYKEAMERYYKTNVTDTIDVKDGIILPGFIDAHAHVAQYVYTLPLANISSSPYGNVNNIDSLIATMKRYIAQKYPSNNDAMAIGNNYDDAQMAGNKQPTKADLDRISTTHPIYVSHISGHMGVGNTKFFSILGITDSTPSDSIPGGTIVKENNKVTGLLLENAHIAALQLAVSKSTEFPKDSMLPRLLQAEQTWFRYGITTMCEGRADPNSIALIQAANAAGKLTGDFIVLPDYDLNKAKLKDYAKYYNKYDGHFKIGAFKFTFDGSPQGRSAYLSHAYLNPPVGSDSTYKGHPIYPYDSAAKYIEGVLDAGMPVHVHCNGDSAIDMVLSIFTALKNKNKLQKATPNVIIHTQICRVDQLAKMQTLAGPVMESFFPTHVYLWGNWYRDVVLGPDRARHISPLADANKYNLRYTIHTDAPVTPPDLMAGVYGAVNRKTMTGDTLGYDQRISAYQALKSITSEAAYQWGEDGTKGQLKKDYIADIVVLDKDPVTIDPNEIKKVNVLYTFKNGKQVYPYTAAGKH